MDAYYPLAFQKIPGIPGIIFNFNQEPRIAPQLQPDLTQTFVCSLWDIYLVLQKSACAWHALDVHTTLALVAAHISPQNILPGIFGIILLGPGCNRHVPYTQTKLHGGGRWTITTGP